MFHLVLCSLFLEGIAEFTCDMIHVTLNHIIKSCLIWFSLLLEGVAEFPGLHSNLIESRCTKSLLNLIKISRTGENFIKYNTLEQIQRNITHKSKFDKISHNGVNLIKYHSCADQLPLIADFASAYAEVNAEQSQIVSFQPLSNCLK